MHFLSSFLQKHQKWHGGHFENYSAFSAYNHLMRGDYSKIGRNPGPIGARASPLYLSNYTKES